MFKNAIVRIPGINFTEGLTTANMGSPIVEEALEQHEKYCEALPFLAVASGIGSAGLIGRPERSLKFGLRFALCTGVVLWWGVSAVSIYRYYLAQVEP